MPLFPAGIREAAHRLGPGGPDELAIRQAAWVARCVGRGEAAPLTRDDLNALAATLRTRRYAKGSVLFREGTDTEGVWIVQRGRVELSVGSGRRRVVVQLMRPGDVDGDIQHLLQVPLPYTARALDDTSVLALAAEDFEALLTGRLSIARRWLSSVAQRLAVSQNRIIGLLGRSLPQQIARLLVEESIDGEVPLPQHTLAAMIGVQRPSLNKVLKQFERDGLVEVRYAAIKLANPAKLSELAELAE